MDTDTLLSQLATPTTNDGGCRAILVAQAQRVISDHVIWVEDFVRLLETGEALTPRVIKDMKPYVSEPGGAFARRNATQRRQALARFKDFVSEFVSDSDGLNDAALVEFYGRLLIWVSTDWFPQSTESGFA